MRNYNFMFSAEVSYMKPAILNDISRCIGCKSCVYACKDINELPQKSEYDAGIEPGSELNADTWCSVHSAGSLNIKRQCMHCEDPTCVSVCPVAALYKTEEGPVIYRSERCIGCRYCMVGCPFDIPKYQWKETSPFVQKCIMCFEKRLQEGKEPACTQVCPAGATQFGDRDELIAIAQKRIEDNPGRYVNHIYGLKEAGGTAVMHISPVPFEKLGFKTGVKDKSYPALTWNVIEKLPAVIAVGGVISAGIYWLTSRREDVAAEERALRRKERMYEQEDQHE